MSARERSKSPEVLSHWYTPVPNFSASITEFYDRVEAEVASQEIPGLTASRVEIAEGGLLSANRVYLRFERERLVFDICAAPFGKNFFFSCRLIETAPPITVWHMIALPLLAIFFLYLFVKLWSLLGILAFVAFLIGTIYVLRNAPSLGLNDLDVALTKSPLLSPVYFRFFRKETYYRHDTRLMYLDVVNEITKQAVKAATGNGGVELIRMNEHSPLLEDLYKPRFIRVRDDPKRDG